ncbi:TonB family protein [Modicisalibacter tunisiensis]|uniref:Protein TonB n=1 Tax=Modicisalibacter tunisiensis TaxID=390637 RepID=A0ABS7X184_9GAMM|nr:TonB family protein [Modicisalibacter tunisiensis]MBZ9568667.1 TonB family protein [Modicisalibacter tunisiensis]
MRHLLGALGGAVLALVLLTLLALLVAPPVDQRPEIQPPMTVALVEAPQQQAPSSEPAPEQAAPRPLAAMPSPPPPAAIPSPSPTQPIAVPTPDLPSPRAPALPLDRRLPELTTQQPEPQPKPASKPEPEPTSRVAEAPAGDSAPKDASQTPAANHGVVNSSRPTRRVPPTYPARAQRRGIEGYVEVRFTIRPDGSVDRDSLRVVDAEPRNVFDRAALKAIADWQFPRASRPREARQRLVFKLRG